MNNRLQERIKARTELAKIWLDRVTNLVQCEVWDQLSGECYLGASMFSGLNDDLNELADREQLASDQKSESK
jgi:hypothetical protein